MNLTDLIGRPAAELHALLQGGGPLDLEAMADTRYLGLDLSLPPMMARLLWKTFRKTFHQDGDLLRGWNVRLEQRGLEGAQAPLLDRAGRPLTFGHYHVRSTAGLRFPRWSGAHYLDYTVAGNRRLDLARFGFTPLVSLDHDSSLLLGWEVFRFGPLMAPLPLYYALRREGPLEPADYRAKPVSTKSL